MQKEEFQAINIIIKNREITNLRKKYDLNYDSKFKNHITLVYPFKNLDQKLLAGHIKDSIKGIKPLTVTFNRFWKFKKNSYIYIISEKDQSKFTNLHKKLNSKLLKDIKISKYMSRYVPHISLVGFKGYIQADKLYKQISEERFNIKAKVDSIQLLTIGKNHNIKKIKNFKLK